ncbi:MAG TPA: creatininase family protein [Thermoanaerobaculia bacterium]|nr:creatininase family protein [Thermoanaerobaculia bacterium]
MKRLVDMTWEEVRDLDRARAVAILPVGAIEAHGPHLPLGTDGILAEGMAREGARRLAAAGREAVVLPILWYTAAPFAASFPGTVAVGAETVTRLVLDAAEALARQRFATLALANAHLDPAHLGSLEAVVRGAPAGLRVVFPNLVRRRFVARLGEEFATGACHAGRFEGSVVRAERPDLYRAEVAAGLAPNPASLSAAIAEGRGSFEAAGGPRAYFGWPALADAEEGRAALVELGAILAESVLEALAEEPGGSHARREEGP